MNLRQFLLRKLMLFFTLSTLITVAIYILGASLDPAARFGYTGFLSPLIYAGACVILAVMVIRHLAKVRGNEQKFRDALHGRDRLRGKDGRTFSPELLISLVIPIVFIGINIAMQ